MKRIAKNSKTDAKKNKSLIISQERVRDLSEAQLAHVAGGTPCMGSRPTL